MNTPMTQALALIKSLWPQTSTWPAATWQAWAALLADLDPADLAAGIRRAASSEAWPSVAAIRKGALADKLAPALAVALGTTHPVVREVRRECMVIDEDGREVFDEKTFGFRYQRFADEWNNRLIAGDDVALPGNDLEDRKELARVLRSQVEFGEMDPGPLLAEAPDEVIDELVGGAWGWVYGAGHRPQPVWSDRRNDYIEPTWCDAVAVALRAEYAKRIAATLPQLEEAT